MFGSGRIAVRNVEGGFGAVEIDGDRLIPEPRGNRPHKLTHIVLIADLVVGRSLVTNVALRADNARVPQVKGTATGRNRLPANPDTAY